MYITTFETTATALYPQLGESSPVQPSYVSKIDFLLRVWYNERFQRRNEWTLYHDYF
jgi:hypothetical protein